MHSSNVEKKNSLLFFITEQGSYTAPFCSCAMGEAKTEKPNKNR
jgi:hypothetical protein